MQHRNTLRRLALVAGLALGLGLAVLASPAQASVAYPPGPTIIGPEI
ncbi:hypothetical protein AB0M46_36645 [Dactylosporangium sp. NPDC051485]